MTDYRGTGRTTEQMKSAPVGAVFIWCNSNLAYPKGLAEKLGRQDLQIESPSWLSFRNIAGREFVGVVVDHASHLDAEALYALDQLRTRIRENAS
jgi:hypothetical protein